MFTGIVEEVGRVRSLDGGRLMIACRKVANGVEIGASIAVGGVCLTVVDAGDDTLSFDLSEETLGRTTLGAWRPGRAVDLERPVTLSSRLGGHLVQGHVDGLGVVESVDADGDGGSRIRFSVPPGIDRYLVEKGSIAVDGVSLTLAAVGDRSFEVALVPHTNAVTTLGSLRPGDRVNIEVDMMARYVERLLEGART